MIQKFDKKQVEIDSQNNNSLFTVQNQPKKHPKGKSLSKSQVEMTIEMRALIKNTGQKFKQKQGALYLPEKGTYCQELLV